MCTLSWLLNDQGYEIFFNRDEQRTRPEAIPPALIKQYAAIMPIDPQGKGTWIATSTHGMTLCLLNNYQQQAMIENKKKYNSRGQIIPQLIKTQQADNLCSQLETLDLNNYLPFFLYIFPADLNKKNASVYAYQWNGKQLSPQATEQPFISSAVQLQQAQHSRKQIFRDIITTKASARLYLAYHASHLPEKGALSVCMHRDDARTQSLSHISVSNDILFRYHNGPPCENNNWTETETIKI